MAVTRLFLIRHAEVEARYQNVFGGRIDMDLSPRGHQQACALAAYLDRLPLESVYASPMRRVQQTLAPWQRNGAPSQVALDDLREVDFGDWTGLAWEDLADRFGQDAWQWLSYLEAGQVPNGETGTAFRARIESCLARIARDQSGRHVAVVCHGGVIRMILSILLAIPLPQMVTFAVDYASVTRVALTRPRPQLELLNFTPWRRLP